MMARMIRKILVCVLCVCLVLSCLSCSKRKEMGETVEPQLEFTAEKSAAGEGAGVEAGGSYLFTDHVGRQVQVPKEIKKILPAGPLAQIILYSIAPELFVGLADPWKEEARGFIPNYQFELPYLGKLYGSASLNVEGLAFAAPDCIIDIGQENKSTVEDLDTLQNQTGIPSVFFSASIKSMAETYRILGKFLGRQERGEELACFCEETYARTLKIMEKVGDKKVRSLYVLGEEGLNVIAANSYHSELLDMLTENVAVVDNPLAKGTGNEVSMEQIALWNPDFVIFDAGSIYHEVKNKGAWNSISGVASGRYVEVPAVPHNWMGLPPSVQRYLAMIWLPAILYPQYCDYAVKTEICRFYQLFYGHELTDSEYENLTQRAFF